MQCPPPPRVSLPKWLLWLAIPASGCQDEWCGRFQLQCAEEVELDRDVVDADSDGFPADEDCDDQNADVHPGALDLCDGVDSDCNGAIDNDAPGWAQAWPDLDGDGYGDESGPLWVCDAALGTVRNGMDCDDTSRWVNPGSQELCDGLDNDCDGVVDDNPSDALTFGLDRDGDGQPGSWGVYRYACEPPDGYADITVFDCDDTNPAAWTDAPELCDEVDNDCDLLVDAEDPDLAPDAWRDAWNDLDGDGFGWGAPESVCSSVPGLVFNDDDCGDDDADVYPGAAERCLNLVDDDCDGRVDEGRPQTGYIDGDGDGFGDDAQTRTVCELGGPFIDQGGDCEPGQGGVYPGAVEVCGDGWIQDCDADVAECGGETEVGLADVQATWAGLGGPVSSMSSAPGQGDPAMWVGSEVGGRICTLDSDRPDTVRDCIVGRSGWVGFGREMAPMPDSAHDEGGALVAYLGDSRCVAGGGLATLLILPPAGDGERWLEDADRAATWSSCGVAGVGTLVATGVFDESGQASIVVGAQDGPIWRVFPGEPNPFLQAAAALLPASSVDVSAIDVGDVDGDGLDDLVVGAAAWDGDVLNAGAAFVMLGPLDQTQVYDADGVWTGGAGGLGCGHALGVGDHNGDGLDDVVVGCRGDDALVPATALLVLGQPSLGFDALGAISVASVDLAGEGLAGEIALGEEELALGLPRASSGVGRIGWWAGPMAGVYTLDDADLRVLGDGVDSVGGAPLRLSALADGEISLVFGGGASTEVRAVFSDGR